jgi:hypothetical protein
MEIMVLRARELNHYYEHLGQEAAARIMAQAIAEMEAVGVPDELTQPGP